MSEKSSSFSFLVLTYNHEAFIIQHLESIKYLTISFGDNIDIDLIISDDHSVDKTKSLIEAWLVHNSNLFRHVTVLFSTKNIGTCASLNNMLDHMRSLRCKITAGDDLYSFQNIFELTECDSEVSMVSGRVLHLVNDVLYIDKLSNILETATQVIYDKTSLLHRFKHLSYNNAPNMLYSTECLMHPQTRNFLSQFDVVEDWPIQVAIARQYPKKRFKLVDAIFVYYRRTGGSTYIVANQRFINDKIKLFYNFLDNEISLIEKIRISSRKFCFIRQNLWINRYVNIDFYFFAVSCIFRFWDIISRHNMLKLELLQHQQHFAYIKAAASLFEVNFILSQKKL